MCGGGAGYGIIVITILAFESRAFGGGTRFGPFNVSSWAGVVDFVCSCFGVGSWM